MTPRADSAPMALTLGIWLCALPIIFLLIGPAFGLKAPGRPRADCWWCWR